LRSTEQRNSDGHDSGTWRPGYPHSSEEGSQRAWGGSTLAYYSDRPTLFWITALSGLVYLAGLAARFRAP
jgi:hypothetical protein